MQCVACHYLLWNIRDRRCPECGSDFRVSEHTFRPGSVQFRCPHCEQPYFGTDPESGHLVPRTFDCVRCSNRIDMDEMVLLPAQGVGEGEATERHPWIERRRGLFFAWVHTVALSCFSPVRLIRLTRERDAARPAMMFMLVTLAIAFACGLGMLMLFVLTAGGMVGGYSFASMTRMLAAFCIPFAVLAGAIGAWLLVTHGVLAITGTTLGLRRTTHAICYSCGPVVLASIPCLGMYVIPFAALWWIINAAVMLSPSHRISGLRATLAALALPGLAVALLAILFAQAVLSMT
ncbi:MAG: hypothetical protein KF787_06525 [Phycisphaeraceae bacterium]|nr:hypothetical protein [Phycisphaerae bacterium]MBX3392287.1 hypothetical protein [Phycisphaeraceae bacterium]HRJ49847.1 YIP1 family protein [Phycisphaerales bacterium]